MKRIGWLLGVTIGMGVLIVVGVVVLVVAMAQRLGGGGTPGMVALHEAPGTHILGASAAGDRVAVQLGGGGPDRVVVVDTRTGRILVTIGLAP